MTLPTFTAAERAALTNHLAVEQRVAKGSLALVAERHSGTDRHTYFIALDSALAKLLAWLDQQEATE